MKKQSLEEKTQERARLLKSYRASVRASACATDVSKESAPRSISVAMQTPVTAFDRLAYGTAAPGARRPIVASCTG